MRIYEHETKEVLDASGVPTTARALVTTAQEACAKAAEIGFPVALKAQTLIKARGKAGLILFADTPDEVARSAEDLLGRNHHGERIEKLLIEEKMAFDRELYLGFVVDHTACRSTLIVSQKGGVDIEEIGQVHPDRIKKILISPSLGISDSEASSAAAFLTDGLEKARGQAEDIIHRAYKLFVGRDMEMLEINPLVYRSDRGLVAIDAAAALDEEALYRQADLVVPRGQSQAEFEREQDFRKRGWSYIQFDGNIGLLSSGAGVTMAILDLMRKAGGKPANFLDTAQMNRKGIYDAFHIFYGNPDIKTVVVNIFAGLNRCDELALGIKDFLIEYQPEFKVVIRMVGNMEDEGHSILEQIGIKPLRGLEEMVEQAIKITEEQA